MYGATWSSEHIQPVSQETELESEVNLFYWFVYVYVCLSYVRRI